MTRIKDAVDWLRNRQFVSEAVLQAFSSNVSSPFSPYHQKEIPQPVVLHHYFCHVPLLDTNVLPGSLSSAYFKTNQRAHSLCKGSSYMFIRTRRILEFQSKHPV